MRRQFRIEILPQEGAQVGTTVRVFVEGKKIPADEENGPVKPLDVTAYLSIVAGFVEFPIVITEGDHKTIVLHPKQDFEAIHKRFGEEFEVHQLDLTYPWQEAILPQDLPSAREVFREVSWDIASGLNLAGYDGVLSYLVPVDDSIDLRALSDKARVVAGGQAEQVTKDVRWHGNWDSYTGKVVGISRSSIHPLTYSVYRDGILLPVTSSPHLEPICRRAVPLPRLIVNLPKSRAPRVDLARTQLLGQPGRWDSPVFQAHLRQLFETSIKELLALDPAVRLYQLGRLIAFHNIDAESLWQVFPHERWPVPFVEAGGRFNVLEWQEVAPEPIHLPPESLEGEFMKICSCQWLTQEEYEGPLLQWAGGRCVISTAYAAEGVGICSAVRLWEVAARKTQGPAAIQFLQPPWKGDPPLVQWLWIPAEVPEEHPQIEGVLEKAVEDPILLNPFELAVLRKEAFKISYKLHYLFSEAIGFPQPFEQSFAYEGKLLNLKHPVTQALLRITAALGLARRRRTLPKDQLGHMHDALDSLPHLSSVRAWQWGRLSNALRRIWSLARKVKLFDHGEIEDLVLAPEDFVPGTVIFDQKSCKGVSNSLQLEKLQEIGSIRPFGMPLT